MADVLHDPDGAGPNGGEFDTNVYWAEWQLASATDYTIDFSSFGPHTSLAQVRVDYLNSASLFDASAPSLVPEPHSALLLSIAGFAVVGVSRRRTKRDLS